MFLPVALPIAMLASPASAGSAVNSVACVSVQLKSVDRASLVRVVKAGYKPRRDDPNESAASYKIGDAINYCRARNGWSQARQNLAVFYLSGDMLRGDAVLRGKSFGLSAAMLDGIVAGLDGAARQKIVAGGIDAALSAALSKAVQDAGIAIDPLSADDRTKLVGLLRQGLQGTIIAQEAQAAYATS